MKNRTCYKMRLFSLLFAVKILVGNTLFVLANEGDYTNEWVMEIDGGDDLAHEIAHQNDFDIIGKVFDDVYHLKHRRLVRRSLEASDHHHQSLTSHPKVKWAEQQVVKRRVKRDFQMRANLFEAVTGTSINDPKWTDMWYLNRGGAFDMNVIPAWQEGVTGKGVVVTILDDGLEKDHPDIIKNYDPNASYDVNGHDPDPMPRYDLLNSNRHGTRCAGEVAAQINNSICAVGVAYEASVGGVRMLDGDVTDAVEAKSLALNPQHIDIYSASWGPDDDGKTVDGPGQLATRAFTEGITNGRNGKGSIFVWASGNGGRDRDNCNCDGYTNSIWTLSISSSTEKGRVPWYSEACSSTLATTYSSGASGENQIITTDLHHSCTITHTGTSASAPLAAGICALALQVNKNMTWRDMQHIVVRTARPENLEANDWQTNGAQRRVSHRFGYGLMDAHAMVKLARNWTTVPPQKKCQVNAPHVDKLIPQKSHVTLTLEVTECKGVNYLEHVQAKISLIAGRRGDIEIYLTSPAGTKSTLLAQRPNDKSHNGFRAWPFMTVHMWGEKPFGIWKLEIHNNGHFYTTGEAEIKGWDMDFYGTETAPGEPTTNQPTTDQEFDVSSNILEPTNIKSSDMISEKKKGNPGEREVCDGGLFLYMGKCLHTCPVHFFGWRPENTSVIIGESAEPSCRPCHYTCWSCTGPLDYQCSQCWGDAMLYTPNGEEKYCRNLSFMRTTEDNKWWTTIVIILLVIMVLLVFILLIFVIRTRKQFRTRYATTRGPNGRPISARTVYANVPLMDEKLITKIPFHDLSSDEE